MIKGTNLLLEKCNNKLWHEFYKSYVSDSMMESSNYVYNSCNVEKDFQLKTNDITRQYFFIITQNQVIGQIYLKRMDKDKLTTEMGIALINNEVKGIGYGTEAIKLLVDYAFFSLGFKKILASTVLRNLRSQHILEKLGFVFKYQDSVFKYYEKDCLCI